MGPFKGHCLVWEKYWDSIKFAKDCQKIVPIIDGVFSERPSLLLMQDNAPAHAAYWMME